MFHIIFLQTIFHRCVVNLIYRLSLDTVLSGMKQVFFLYFDYKYPKLSWVVGLGDGAG